MAFELEPTRTPTQILDIVIQLKDGAGGEDFEPYQHARFIIDIGMSDGTVTTRQGDLVPHITPAQRQALIDFMSGLRTQAEQEILP